MLEVLAGFIYCFQENGPKEASSCFEEFMVLNAPPLTQLGLKEIIACVASASDRVTLRKLSRRTREETLATQAGNNSYHGDEKTPENTAHRDDDDDDDNNNNNNYNNNNNNNNNSFILIPSPVFIALMQVGPCKCVKQIIQIKLNRVKNPNWPEANQLATSMDEDLNSRLP